MHDDGLYSIPTINQDVPPVEIVQNHDLDIVIINHKDWRQVEFVSTELEFYIEIGFNPIKTIYREHRIGKKFNQIHKRTSPEDPLEDVSLTLEELETFFNGALQKAEGIALAQADHLIQNGFAYKLKGLSLYGIAKEGNVTILGLHPIGDSINTDGVTQILELAAAKSLYLVDWKNMLRLTPDPEIYSQYFL